MSHLPTRATLLLAIHRLQNLIGAARGFYHSQRDPQGQGKGRQKLDAAYEICEMLRAIAEPTPRGRMRIDH